MNILRSYRTNGLLRMLNTIAIVVIYKVFGIDWVIIYGIINIDAHIDELSEKLDRVIKRQS